MLEFENPFTPSFGEVPAHMAGRQQIVSSLIKAFTSERRRPDLTSLFSGARGTGKTTLLRLLAHKAEENGWVAVDTTALPGMLDDIEIGLHKTAGHLLKEPPAKRVSSIEIASVGAIAFEQGETPKTNWRYRMTDLVEQLGESGTGLLITVDEVDPQLDEMVELAAVYQHLVGEGHKVALLMAGLPHNISALLSDKTVSFLRRAQSHTLGRIADYDVYDALARTISENGRDADAQGLEDAVAAIGGFPFLLQLVGYRSWDVNPSNPMVSKSDFTQGIDIARHELEDRILGATFRELSDGDIKFLTAMLEDEGDSKVADLAERLERSSAVVSQYRRRLIDAGVIGERRRGVVGFDLPYFREYLAEQVGFES